MHILHINPKYAGQNQALLDTLGMHQSNNICFGLAQLFY
jgi:hypothetical protein